MLCIKVHCIIIPFNLHDNPMRWAFFFSISISISQIRKLGPEHTQGHSSSNQQPALASAVSVQYLSNPTLGVKGLFFPLLSALPARSIICQSSLLSSAEGGGLFCSMPHLRRWESLSHRLVLLGYTDGSPDPSLGQLLNSNQLQRPW